MSTSKPLSLCEWSCQIYDYPANRQKRQLSWEEVSDHPLKPLVVTVIESRVTRRTLGGSTTSSTGSSTPTPTLESLAAALEGTDPLTHFARQEMDPLSKMAADMWEPVPTDQRKSKDALLDDVIEPWATRKSAILNKFTTSEKLSIVTSFLSGGEKVVVKAQSSVVDKVKNRLEQLDDFEEGSVRQMMDLTQQEYMHRIEQLNQELVQAWNHDQRVKALKIAIQCSKLLVDTSVIQFYPSKFVLITDILDIFGKLVYDRLRTKAEYYIPGSKTPTSLPESFTPDMVPESAKETCRNWFYKIASIRELVPRLYVEMAILKSYSFLTSSEFSQALLRLTRMIRGIGDPLVAVYAHCYLCRVGMAVTTGDREYIKENFYDFVASYNQSREVNTFLGDIIRHMTPERAYEHHYPQLQAVVNKVLTHTRDFESLFTMDKFLPLLDLFQKESIKVEVCKSIMDAFTHNNVQQEPTNDPVIINALMFICRVMHDSVNALTVDDEKRQIGNLISGFVKKVDYGRDFEQQLSFYVEARSAFPNLDSVHAQLVQSVNRLSVETRRIVKGHHTRKTAAFVRACAAYCYITIPSITSVQTRLELYLLSGEVALLNQCLGQVDACLKAALSLVPGLPRTIEVDGKQRSSEPYLISYLCHFLSTLLVVPDSPEQGVLYLTRGLLNVLQQYAWEPTSNARCVVYLHVLDMLSAAAQETYLYHIEKVDSNDILYGSDPKFISEINKMCSVLLEEILSHLKYLNTNEQFQKQASLAMDLFARVVIRGDLKEPSMTTLAINLWNLAHRHGHIDPKLSARTLEYLKKKSMQPGGNLYADLVKKLHMQTS
ncbi:hypothetical protein B7P43_G06573 [Cryptotermes secundus]|uniref:VPS35 endosomal protein sorting factor-like n=1 Tax=Cryptotermes secundus TaxID=105785 RepID=A0A2J7QTV1_9NEOP|nr:hypothetical protein B7P43_G06573 [Cryptotermes secundus]